MQWWLMRTKGFPQWAASHKERSLQLFKITESKTLTRIIWSRRENTRQEAASSPTWTRSFITIATLLKNKSCTSRLVLPQNVPIRECERLYRAPLVVSSAIASCHRSMLRPLKRKLISWTSEPAQGNRQSFPRKRKWCQVKPPTTGSGCHRSIQSRAMESKFTTAKNPLIFCQQYSESRNQGRVERHTLSSQSSLENYII